MFIFVKSLQKDVQSLINLFIFLSHFLIFIKILKFSFRFLRVGLYPRLDRNLLEVNTIQPSLLKGLFPSKHSIFGIMNIIIVES